MTTPTAAQTTSGGTHPPGCYYVQIATGTIQRQCNPVLAAGLALAGFVGQDSLPADGFNAFATFQDAQNFAGSHTISGAISSVTNWVSGISDFFGFLTQRQTLVRLAEGAVGLLLVIVGARVFLQAEALDVIGISKPVKSLTKAVKK